jgi:phospholipid N-methyltransferase
VGDALLFFKNFLTNPTAIGSVIPSSPHLVNDLLAGIDFDRARVIVEYGPGTGVFTDEIARRLHPDAKLLSIELLDEFYSTLATRYQDPRVILIHGSAADVRKHLEAHGLGPADAIVSGLPFTSLPDGLRHEILTETTRALAPGGRFYLYQYSKFLVGHLQRYFEEIQTRWTFLNVPPAFSFYCERPKLGADAPPAPAPGASAGA